MIDAERLQNDVIEEGERLEALIQRCGEQHRDIQLAQEALDEMGDGEGVRRNGAAADS